MDHNGRVSTNRGAESLDQTTARWFYSNVQLVTGAVVFTVVIAAALYSTLTHRIATPIGIGLVVVMVGLALWFPGMHTAKVGPAGLGRPLRRFIPADQIEFVTLKFDGVQFSVALVLPDGKRVGLMPMADKSALKERAEEIADLLGKDFVDINQN